MPHVLGEELGRGALGRVVAVAGPNGERLAGKILHPSHRGDAGAAERFRREAELLRGLRHPNVVEVFGLQEIEGELVLLMERVDGPTLAEVIARDAPLPEGRIAAVARGIAAGLHAAHRSGLVHRDLKPANVLLAAGDTAKLVDFGLARASSFAGVDRASFTLVGTPDYLAPEAIDPLAVDPRSDLYSLGCMLYEMATGQPPYPAATPFAVVEAHRSAPLPELEPTPGRSERLVSLIRALLAKSPADRPPSAAFVEETLATTTGLVPAVAVAVAARCPHCGAPLVPDVPVCFGCARRAVRLEPGPMTVFVTGPGGMTHKIDSALRQRLCDWIAANPGLGLDAAVLYKEIPRLPFALVSGIDRKAAADLVAALVALELQAEAREGGRMGLQTMRRKAWTVTGRHLAASAAILGPMVGQITGRIGLGALAAALAIVFGAAGRGWWSATRPVGQLGRASGETLPPALAERVEKLATVLPGIRAARHREALRGVVRRVMALRAAIPPHARAEWDAELAEVIDVALVAAGRLDVLEEGLLRADLRETDAATARDLHERDTWAARLLEVTARLDALRARWAVAAAGSGEDLLDDLRAQVLALEEVSRL